MQASIICPRCRISLDSHETFAKTGVLMDEHYKTKHNVFYDEARGEFVEGYSGGTES